jgi:hypothetical protein
VDFASRDAANREQVTAIMAELDETDEKEQQRVAAPAATTSTLTLPVITKS